MISKLIVPPKAKELEQVSKAPDTAIYIAAKAFVNGMGDNQRARFKRMIQSGIECGESIAQTYGVPRKDFIAEVSKLL